MPPRIFQKTLAFSWKTSESSDFRGQFLSPRSITSKLAPGKKIEDSSPRLSRKKMAPYRTTPPQKKKHIPKLKGMLDGCIPFCGRVLSTKKWVEGDSPIHSAASEPLVKIVMAGSGRCTSGDSGGHFRLPRLSSERLGPFSESMRLQVPKVLGFFRAGHEVIVC